MVCSACGHEGPPGNRFCGMCGTPLPHPPLDTPGAQSTMNLTRGPLAIHLPAERQSAAVDVPVAPPSDDELSTDAFPGGRPQSDETASQGVPASLGDTIKPAPVLVETLKEQACPVADLPSDGELVSEDRLQVFADNLEHPQLNQPEEAAGTDETRTVSSGVLAFADALPALEPAPPVETPHFEWMDDVLDEIELEAAKLQEGHDEPRSPDVPDELSVQGFESNPLPLSDSASTVPLETSAAPSLPSPARIRLKEPRSGRWRTPVAIAAAVMLGAVTLMQWMAYKSQTDGPVEVIESKIHDLMPGNQEDADRDQPGTLADSGANTPHLCPKPNNHQSRRTRASQPTRTLPTRTLR